MADSTAAEPTLGILIIGAGGHGQTVADALLKLATTDAQRRIVGFLDDTPALQGTHYQGIPVLGPIRLVTQVTHDGVIVAIGDNHARRRFFLQLQQRGVPMVSVVHPSATLALDVEVGPGCYIGANAVVGVACRIGANTIINGGGCLGHHNRIGEHAHIAPGVHTAKSVSIGDGAQVGVGATVYPDRTVGAWSIVGGGSLVAHDIAEGVLAVGSPARAIRRLPPAEHAAD